MQIYLNPLIFFLTTKLESYVRIYVYIHIYLHIYHTRRWHTRCVCIKKMNIENPRQIKLSKEEIVYLLELETKSKNHAALEQKNIEYGRFPQ